MNDITKQMLVQFEFRKKNLTLFFATFVQILQLGEKLYDNYNY